MSVNDRNWFMLAIFSTVNTGKTTKWHVAANLVYHMNQLYKKTPRFDCTELAVRHTFYHLKV